MELGRWTIPTFLQQTMSSANATETTLSGNVEHERAGSNVTPKPAPTMAVSEEMLRMVRRERQPAHDAIGLSVR